VPEIIINDTINSFFKLQWASCRFQTITVSECCVIKLLPYIILEKYVYILALEMASRGNQHCANGVGTLSFPMNHCPNSYDKGKTTPNKCPKPLDRCKKCSNKNLKTFKNVKNVTKI